MKKLTYRRIFVILSIILCVGNAHAQQNVDHNWLASVSSVSDLLNYASPSSSSLSNPPDELKVSPKALQSFTKLYQNPEFVRWAKNNKTYLATFNQDNKKYRVAVGENGKLIYSLCYIQEKDMPFDVRKMVKTVYYDYAINVALLVKQDNRTIWLILMEDSNKYLTVRIEDDEMEEVSKMDKIK
jgi:hypothetical protein